MISACVLSITRFWRGWKCHEAYEKCLCAVYHSVQAGLEVPLRLGTVPRISACVQSINLFRRSWKTYWAYAQCLCAGYHSVLAALD
jgi:hypothetical protein